MIKKAYIKKIAIRFLIINVIYFLIKLTIAHDDKPEMIDRAAIFYYFTAFILFMLTWEVNDWLIKKDRKSLSSKDLSVKSSIAILLKTLLIVCPTAAVIYYLGIFQLDFCQIQAENPWLRFRIDFLRATLLGASLSIFNQFYRIIEEKKEVEAKVHELKKEMMTSKYNSLKSQISPHFLFNSLNTLTSLMYEDRDLASDFVTRLASCYRYILDNREEDLVSLDKELQFLDSFIFMMKVRHDGSISISTDIDAQHKMLLIPTLSIQMLVENALKHNYYSKEQPIRIEIFTKNDVLVIKNNIRKRNDSNSSLQLGLANIKKRYAFYTNEGVTVKDDSKNFVVVMPLLPSHLIRKETLSIPI
ncbi:histidine kinase [uncultured Winogradskyella sp.]|uniref:sensor histidine kinase n=1 Tax=uncultured Winogradskyella sp. TaxID=395353 RepID=UPI00262EEAD3|nr:histidine kinase [uncultured Winogradskyella sp.]